VIHFESFIGLASVHHSSSVTFSPLTLAFFYSGVIKSSIYTHIYELLNFVLSVLKKHKNIYASSITPPSALALSVINNIENNNTYKIVSPGR
jgi:hypothetical protein